MFSTTIPFVKMHGLGNDFIIFDTRAAPFKMTKERAKAVADRRLGVGCDQLILIEQSQSTNADVFMRIYNSDGGEAGACGNATRCVADYIMRDTSRHSLTIHTVAGFLSTRWVEQGVITVNMGPAKLEWRDIPLAEERDTLNVGIQLPPLSNPVAVSMGNPHAVFFVENVEQLDLEVLGSRLEHHPIFPERANISVASIVGKDEIRLRVFERGAGITPACGTGACAAGVASARRGLTSREVTVHMDGGPLSIEWLENGEVLMTGPVTTVFHGYLRTNVLPEA